MIRSRRHEVPTLGFALRSFGNLTGLEADAAAPKLPLGGALTVRDCLTQRFSLRGVPCAGPFQSSQSRRVAPPRPESRIDEVRVIPRSKETLPAGKLRA